MSIFSNFWVSNVLTSIIGSAILYFITDWWQKRRLNKQYYTTVKLANKELIETLRPLISNKLSPEEAMIKKLKNSLSRKYEIDSNDMLSEPEIEADLTLEVLENAFLNPQQKVNYCKIINIRNPAETIPIKLIPIKSYEKTFRSLRLILSIATFLMLFLLSTTITAYNDPEIRLHYEAIDQKLMSIDWLKNTPLLYIFCAISIVFIIIINYKRISTAFKRFFSKKRPPRTPFTPTAPNKN